MPNTPGCWIPTSRKSKSLRIIKRAKIAISHCRCKATLRPCVFCEESLEGLLIVDVLAKFASPSFIELLRVCGNAGVSVVYTNQSFSELANPELNLHASFADELISQTNARFCFQLGSEESARLVMQRMGLAAAPKSKAEDGKKGASVDVEFLKNLEVGRCVLFMRQPRTQAVLKTGYFKFDQPLPFRRQEKSRQTVAAAQV